jgi:hypothetical protein
MKYANYSRWFESHMATHPVLEPEGRLVVDEPDVDAAVEPQCPQNHSIVANGNPLGSRAG